MTKQIGSHVDGLLLEGFGNAYENISEALKKHSDLERKQKEVKETLKRNLAIYNEILELKGTKGKGVIEFDAPNRPIAWDITEHKEFEERILAIINS